MSIHNKYSNHLATENNRNYMVYLASSNVLIVHYFAIYSKPYWININTDICALSDQSRRKQVIHSLYIYTLYTVIYAPSATASHLFGAIIMLHNLSKLHY